MVDGAGAQSAERVPAVPGLAPRAPRHQHEGDQLPAAQTVPQVEGGSTTTATTQKIMHNAIIFFFQCERFRTRFDQTARNRMREKVTASLIFKDRKSSYPRRWAKL